MRHTGLWTLRDASRACRFRNAKVNTPVIHPVGRLLVHPQGPHLRGGISRYYVVGGVRIPFDYAKKNVRLRLRDGVSHILVPFTKNRWLTGRSAFCWIGWLLFRLINFIMMESQCDLVLGRNLCWALVPIKRICGLRP